MRNIVCLHSYQQEEAEWDAFFTICYRGQRGVAFVKNSSEQLVRGTGVDFVRYDKDVTLLPQRVVWDLSVYRRCQNTSSRMARKIVMGSLISAMRHRMIGCIGIPIMST